MSFAPRLGDQVRVNVFDEPGAIVAFDSHWMLIKMPWKTVVMATHHTDGTSAHVYLGTYYE